VSHGGEAEVVLKAYESSPVDTHGGALSDPIFSFLPGRSLTLHLTDCPCWDDF